MIPQGEEAILIISKSRDFFALVLIHKDNYSAASCQGIQNIYSVDGEGFLCLKTLVLF
jgi:hypothetical protein